MWASNPSVGDIVGQQLYLLFTRHDQTDHWGYTFIALGCVIFVFGVVTLLFLVEYPSSVGISIKEEGRMLDPSRVSVKKFARTQEDH